MDKIKVLILDVEGEDKEKIVQMLISIEYIQLYDAINIEDAVEVIDETGIDVVLIDTDFDGDGFSVSDQLAKSHPDLAIIIIENSLQEEIMHRAFFANANDVLIKPIQPAKLVDSIHKSKEIVKMREITRKQAVSKTKQKTGEGQIFTVLGSKGGVGKTFFAINLAVGIVKETNKSAVIVDLDLDFGNVALSLNIVPKYTIAGVIDGIRIIDQDYIESYLIAHDSGIKILSSTSEPMSDEYINAADIETILRTLQSVYDYVIIDTPVKITEAIKPSIGLADLLFIVTIPEVAAIRNAKSTIVALNEAYFPKSKIKVVLNKVNRSDKISSKDVEATLNHEVFTTMRYDLKETAVSMNLGIPYIMKNPSSGLSKDIANIIKKTVNKTDVKDKKRRK